jgi:hypothetical protein
VPEAQPLIVSMPPGLDLAGGSVIRVTALDPATGNVVSGVQVYDVTMEVELLSGRLESAGDVLIVSAA